MVPRLEKSEVSLYADDIKLFLAIPSDSKHIFYEYIQQDINNLFQWSLDNLLPFNHDKCCLMLINGSGKNNDILNYFCNNNVLHMVDSHCDLGIMFTNNWKFNHHINLIVRKANIASATIRRTFNFVDKSINLLLYKLFIRPHLEYG